MFVAHPLALKIREKCQSQAVVIRVEANEAQENFVQDPTQLPFHIVKFLLVAEKGGRVRRNLQKFSFDSCLRSFENLLTELLWAVWIPPYRLSFIFFSSSSADSSCCEIKKCPDMRSSNAMSRSSRNHRDISLITAINFHCSLRTPTILIPSSSSAFSLYLLHSVYIFPVNVLELEYNNKLNFIPPFCGWVCCSEFSSI